MRFLCRGDQEIVVLMGFPLCFASRSKRISLITLCKEELENYRIMGEKENEEEKEREKSCITQRAPRKHKKDRLIFLSKT